jgi:N utilization substance protein A
VQSISGQHVTIGLGRTEAILPRSQQVGRERYRAHDKIRVYVLEVRRTNRGPQIFVSRNHRNLLRRLLELEVPEIYNGQVELKSIAREAGQRSKVAVQALQPGVDPVGACVGMRGVRIQSIVRELNDEKIDVIEWNPDQKIFIAKALSPARVSHVFLEDHPDSGRTAVVIVPDDQLSLAIGREGQNARLAAKLTGWRIDIKSLTEAASESLANLGHEAADPSIVKNTEMLEKARDVLAKKEAGRPITSEDYHTLSRIVQGVEGQIVAERVASYEDIRKGRVDARKQVPAIAWTLPLDVLDLPGRAHNLLLDNEVETVGDAMYYLALGDEKLLAFRGFGDKALEDLKAHMLAYELPVDENAEVVIDTDEDVAVVETAVTPIDEVAEIEEEAEEDVEEAEETIVEEDVVIEEPEEEVDPIDAIDDLSKPLIDTSPKPTQSKKDKPAVILARKPRQEIGVETEESATRKGKQLIFDENLGEVITKRKRKRGRQQGDWSADDWE